LQVSAVDDTNSDEDADELEDDGDGGLLRVRPGSMLTQSQRSISLLSTR
jgi:hypothetical protein